MDSKDRWTAAGTFARSLGFRDWDLEFGIWNSEFEIRTGRARMDGLTF